MTRHRCNVEPGQLWLWDAQPPVVVYVVEVKYRVSYGVMTHALSEDGVSLDVFFRHERCNGWSRVA